MAMFTALVRSIAASTLLIACASPSSGDVGTAVASVLNRSTLDSSAVGYAVVDNDTGAIVASRNPDLAFVPASNLKIFSTGAALERLGPGFVFETKLLFAAAEGRSRLTLLGAGDPALFDVEAIASDGSHGNWSSVAAAIDGWASQLRVRNALMVDELLVDARIFDEEPIPSGDAKWKDNEHSTYAVGLWGLNLAANNARVTPGWRAKGRPDIGTVEPPVPFRLAANGANCIANGKSTFSIAAGREPGEIRFDGQLPKSDTTFKVPIRHPLTLGAEMFVREFARRGITIRSWRIAAGSEPVAAGTAVEPVLRTPIKTVLRGANTESLNLYAEALTKRLGAAVANPPATPVGPNFVRGSWALGCKAITDSIDRRIGAGCSGPLCLRDGSGLSGSNRITASVAARWLSSFARDPALGPTYFASFARPRMPGTLENRFKGVKLDGASVFAKSGFIDGVSCLSGLVVGRDGRSYAFSVLCNRLGKKGQTVTEAKQLQERIVEQLVEAIVRGSSTEISLGN